MESGRHSGMTTPRDRSRLGSVLGSDSGQSLILGLVVMFALSISIAAIYAYLTSNEGHFNRDSQSVRALASAEAGLNDALATITKSDPSNAVPVGTTYSSNGTVSLDKGSFTWSTTKYAAPNCSNSLPTCWTITANGTSPTGAVIHQLQQTIGWITHTTYTQIDETPVYGYGLFISNPPGDANCFALSGAVTVSANVWFNGSFCPNGGANITPAAGRDNQYSIYIGGNYLGRNNTNIGTSALKFALADIVGICKKQNTVETCSDSPNSNVWAYPPYLTSSSTLQKPDVNAQAVYTYGTGLGAAGDPTVNWNAPTCSTGSFTFDNNTTMDASLPETTLFSGSSFNCTVKDSSGNTVGSLAWDKSTSTLTVNGAIFIDGDINVPSGTVNYKGDGTIYVNGSLHGGQNVSGTSICGPTLTSAPENGCPGPWNFPTTTPAPAGTGSLMFVFINPNNVATPVNLQGSNHEWQVSLYVVKGFTSNGGTAILGPVLADGGSMAGNTGVDVPPIPPVSAPTSKTVANPVSSWGVTPGDWKQLK
jgi:Tfp pilus assembly protein PilV